jgi:Tfp pilus assembly protein PilW
MKGADGFSLLELMIAAALGVVMTTAILQVFTANSAAQRLLQGQARLQESARHALHFIGQSARAIGYPGCETGGGELSGEAPDPKLAIPVPTAGFDGIGNRLTEFGLDSQQTQPGSDVVVFRRVVDSSTGALSVAGDACGNKAEVREEIYFVARGTRTNDRGEPVWSLRRKAGRSAQQLVAGIEDLQVLYGIDGTPGDDSGPEQYVTADQIGTAAVQAIHVMVIASSVDAAMDDAPLRRPFAQTIAVRNP